MTQAHIDDRDIGAWSSLIIRVAIAALFFSASVSKLKGGWTSIKGTVGFFQKTFAETWLPSSLVTMHGYITPFAEALICIWLIVGFKLKAAWIFTGFFLITLAFGMSVAGNHDAASNNFTYVLMAAIGLYFSRFDRYNADQLVAIVCDDRTRI